MDLVVILTGFFLIGMGFLVKSAPNLIAGYNSVPKDQKKNVDIEGLSTFIRNGLIVIGVLVIISYFPVKRLASDKAAILTMPVVIFIGSIFLAVKARKFDHNRKRNS